MSQNCSPCECGPVSRGNELDGHLTVLVGEKEKHMQTPRRSQLHILTVVFENDLFFAEAKET